MKAFEVPPRQTSVRLTWLKRLLIVFGACVVLHIVAVFSTYDYLSAYVSYLQSQGAQLVHSEQGLFLTYPEGNVSQEEIQEKSRMIARLARYEEVVQQAWWYPVLSRL